MRPSGEEQETTISFGRLDTVAKVYTSDTRYMNKFDKLVEQNPDEWKFIEQTTCQGDVVGKFYECPVKFISFRSKITKRVLTEEERQRASARLAEIRERKKSQST